jgi:HlyD family secretion protein
MDQIVERPEKATFASPEPIEEALALKSAGRRRRRWPLLVLLVLAAGGGLAWWQFGGATTQQVFYRAVPIEPGSLTVEVSATGTLQPLIQVDISSELSGVVRSVAVDENQRVTQGEVLAELDTTRLSAQIEGAKASVKSAEAKVMESKTTLTESEQAFARAEQLQKRGMTAQQTLDTAIATRGRADANVAMAEANLAIAEATLKQQDADLVKSKIYAPIDGIVLTRSVNPGQTVASSMQAPVLFVLAANLENDGIEGRESTKPT